MSHRSKLIKEEIKKTSTNMPHRYDIHLGKYQSYRQIVHHTYLPTQVNSHSCIKLMDINEPQIKAHKRRDQTNKYDYMQGSIGAIDRFCTIPTYLGKVSFEPFSVERNQISKVASAWTIFTLKKFLHKSCFEDEKENCIF